MSERLGPQNDAPVARLVGLTPEVRPAEIDLVGATCTLGRSETCDMVVGRAIVSRLHARVEAAGPRFLLRDAASANGTFVNGRRIQEPHLLADRDEIGPGAAAPVLRFVDPDPHRARRRPAAL